MEILKKSLTEADKECKFVVPSAWLGKLLPADLNPGGKAAVHVLDELGKKYTFWLKLRSPPKAAAAAIMKRYYRKPEFMAKEWKAFVVEKGLKVGDTIYFWREKGHIRVKVRVPPCPLRLFGTTFLY